MEIVNILSHVSCLSATSVVSFSVQNSYNCLKLPFTKFRLFIFENTRVSLFIFITFYVFQTWLPIFRFVARIPS